LSAPNTLQRKAWTRVGYIETPAGCALFFGDLLRNDYLDGTLVVPVLGLANAVFLLENP
jgi:hypothetical protein